MKPKQELPWKVQGEMTFSTACMLCSQRFSFVVGWKASKPVDEPDSVDEMAAEACRCP